MKFRWLLPPKKPQRHKDWEKLLTPNTTYVPGTMTLNAAALTDAADAGEFVTAPAPEIAVVLGDLTGASGAQTVTFSVTID